MIVGNYCPLTAALGVPSCPITCRHWVSLHLPDSAGTGPPLLPIAGAACRAPWNRGSHPYYSSRPAPSARPLARRVASSDHSVASAMHTNDACHPKKLFMRRHTPIIDMIKTFIPGVLTSLVATALYQAAVAIAHLHHSHRHGVSRHVRWAVRQDSWATIVTLGGSSHRRHLSGLRAASLRGENTDAQPSWRENSAHAAHGLAHLP